MHRITSSIALVISLGILLSCAGTSQTAQQDSEPMEVGQYPAWYPDQKVVSGETEISAYAAAIGNDSASAVSKAVDWAETELRSAVGDKLEEVRTNAMKEYGSDSGLDSPQFLIALREANKAVDPLIETGNTEVKTVEGYSSVRSFAEVSVPKDKLVDQIGKLLSDHQENWQKMRESEAFKNF